MALTNNTLSFIDFAPQTAPTFSIITSLGVRAKRWAHVRIDMGGSRCAGISVAHGEDPIVAAWGEGESSVIHIVILNSTNNSNTNTAHSTVSQVEVGVVPQHVCVNSRYLAVANENEARVFDLRSRALLATLPLAKTMCDPCKAAVYNPPAETITVVTGELRKQLCPCRGSTLFALQGDTLIINLPGKEHENHFDIKTSQFADCVAPPPPATTTPTTAATTGGVSCEFVAQQPTVQFPDGYVAVHKGGRQWDILSLERMYRIVGFANRCLCIPKYGMFLSTLQMGETYAHVCNVDRGGEHRPVQLLTFVSGAGVVGRYGFFIKTRRAGGHDFHLFFDGK